MAKVLDAFPTTGTRGRPPIYPWNEWTNGRVYHLKQGVDFASQCKSFRVLVHKTARNLGLKARTEIEPDGVTINIQFYEVDE